MTGFRVQGVAAATALGLLSVAACTSAPSSQAGTTAGGSVGATGAATAGPTTGATPAASPVAGPSGAATADCDSLDNTGNTVAAAVASLRRGSAEGDVLSISAAGQVGGEHCASRAQVGSVNAALRTAANRHVTVVAASGDIGAVAEPCDVYAALAGVGSFTPVKETTLLASDPLVLGAGGTSLTASHATGAWQGETAWSPTYGSVGSPFQASGGGFSRLFSRPGYQDGISAIGADRGVPDVSVDASGHADLAMILRGGGRTMVRDGGGTSASAPVWAAPRRQARAHVAWSRRRTGAAARHSTSTALPWPPAAAASTRFARGRATRILRCPDGDRGAAVRARHHGEPADPVQAPPRRAAERLP